MIPIFNYYLKTELLPEYISLYVKNITSEYVPCSTFDKNGNLIMSIVDMKTFCYFIHVLNKYCIMI